MRFTLLAAVALIPGLLPAQTPPPVLGPAPDLTLQFVDGHTMTLSSLKGKVVALECLYTTCPHCQHASQVFTKLYGEYGSRGFEPVGVAFNDMARMLVDEFVTNFHVAYPVGYAERDTILQFLHISVIERFVVPQIVWIDRKGMIRSKTPPTGDEKMLEEGYWREMIEALIKEPDPSAKKTAPHHTAERKPTG
jgi:peroxiredoxin